MEKFKIAETEGISCILSKNAAENGVSFYTFEISWTSQNAENGDCFEVEWKIPMKEILYRWAPLGGVDRTIAPDWCGFDHSMVSRNAPVVIFFNGKSENRYAWALSECTGLVYYKTGVVEEDGNLQTIIRLPLKQFADRSSFCLTLRIDTGKRSVFETAQQIAQWWEQDLGMKPLSVPAAAKEPMYSFWYSYHQNITAQDIEEECVRAKKLGFKTCIIDDGWQTDDNNRGYAFCGDWEVATAKIPDMKAHVQAVHELGMKYLIWYSVPYMGFESGHFAEYESMLLRRNEGHKTGILDPRYKKVREFLLGIYKKALLEWKLDGFKLDFIDEWREDPANRPYNPEMDIPVLPEAVKQFMTEVAQTLKEINPEILLEFRQGYIGPEMRTFGNMFRVGDCPYDYIKNRVGIFDLRSMMGETAVHSDMLMWHEQEKPELAALQITSILFGVMQYSARLEYMSDEMKKMSRFWMSFMEEHRELLLEAPLAAYDPHQNYTWAKATDDSECVACVYAVDKCVLPDSRDRVYVINGCEGERVLLELDGVYTGRTLDCYGEIAAEGLEIGGRSIEAVSVPVGGMLVLDKK